MFNSLKALWNEPQVPDPQGPQWHDWVLVAVIVCLAAFEGYFRAELAWRPVATAFTIVLLLSLPWRRSRPLRMMLLAFGANSAVQLGALAVPFEWTPLFTTIFLLMLPYSLLRWASGRDAYLGIGFVYVTFAFSIGLSGPPLSEIIAGNLVLLFPAALGASARYRDAANKRAAEQVRLQEREQLARELHDTVAHHVSAIAVQAQAGKALAQQRPQAPIEALEVIETAASNTLREMRRIVKAMRDEGQTDFAPAASIADIQRLARDKTYPFEIEINITGDVENLDATLTGTLFRLTQESLTNAARHAKSAQQVTVDIVRDANQIRLTIEDDGKAVGGPKAGGLGLQGMAERVALLNGSVTAGPGQRQGWVVQAILPSVGVTP